MEGTEHHFGPLGEYPAAPCSPGPFVLLLSLYPRAIFLSSWVESSVATPFSFVFCSCLGGCGPQGFIVVLSFAFDFCCQQTKERKIWEVAVSILRTLLRKRPHSKAQ